MTIEQLTNVEEGDEIFDEKNIDLDPNNSNEVEDIVDNKTAQPEINENDIFDERNIDLDSHQPSPVEDARAALAGLEQAKAAAGMKMPASQNHEREPEAQAELDAWMSLSDTLPRETLEAINIKVQAIKDPILRARTEKYAKANWLYEKSDRLTTEAKKIRAGNAVKADQMLAYAKQLYAKGTKKYETADAEYDAYQKSQKKGLFSRVGGWFKKSK